MPAIAKIRFTHVLYEGGNKRYNDVTFDFHGHNGAVILENGGGKTVFIQTAIQAVLPHEDLAGRKVKDTLLLDSGPAHIAIEWILADKPQRRYLVTCVSLFQSGNGIDSYRYIYEYGERDDHRLAELPFVKSNMGKSRPADKGEIHDYYQSMAQRHSLHAKTFGTIKEYKAYLEQHYQIITSEWEAIVKINGSEGGIEQFFDECKTTMQLFERLLIPAVEESMENYEQGTFARTFEKHREGFKKYKQLTEQIEENRRIQQELNKYVALYERLDHEEKQYLIARQEAKAYWQLTTELQHAVEKKSNQHHVQAEEHEARSRLLQRKQKSYLLAREVQEQEAIAAKLELVEEEAEQIREQLHGNERQYFSFQYAEIRDRCLAAQAKIAQLNAQLERLTLTEDERKLEEHWEQNSARLRYVYDQQEQTMEEQRSCLEQNIGQLMEQIETAKANLDRLMEERLQAEKARAEKDAEIKAKKDHQMDIARRLLSNLQLEKVEQLLPQWMEEEQRLEQGRLTQQQELRRLEEESVYQERRRREVGEDSRRLGEELARLQSQHERHVSDLEELKQELCSLRPAWDRYQSLYEKEASLRVQLAEGIERMLQQKQRLLMKERLAYRYVDDHGQQPLFFADAVVAKLCEQWGHQYSLLQLGTDYIHGLPEEWKRGQESRVDKLWAVTLITTQQEKETLQQRLQEASGGFSFPIRVLSAQEASDQLQGTKDSKLSSSSWIVPQHWMNNEDLDQYEAWKMELSRQAEQAKLEREQVEKVASEWQSVQKRFHAFFVKYPLKAQQDEEQRRLKTQELALERTRELERIEHNLETNRRAADQRRSSIEELGSRIQHLQYQLQQGQQYMLLGSEVSKLEEELVPIRSQLTLLASQREQAARTERLLQDELETVRDQHKEIAFHVQKLKQEDQYLEVRKYAALPSACTTAELKEERKRLDYERHQIMQEQTQLESALAREREREAECTRHMQQLRTEHSGLATDMPLPLDGLERQSRLWSQVEELRRQLKRIEEEQLRTQGDLQAKKGACLKLRQQFTEEFPDAEPERWMEPLLSVQAKLQDEERQLAEEVDQLERQQKAIRKRMSEMGQVMDIWNKHLLFYALEDVRLKPAVIEEANRTEFPYKPIDYAIACIEQLKARVARVDKERSTVKDGRNRMKEYCLHAVQDTKLRYMTMQGIESKESFEELIEFQQSMEKGIQTAIHIMEQNLQTHDQDLQQFIVHVHSHLKLIVQELKEIPKKTRVKSADGWKEIYSFTLAEWDEQDGKERIRKHIDWIITKLDSYTDDLDQTDKQEQQALIRMDLEKWLDSRQLLQIVMQGEGMKVACRKVTNDQQITRAAYSWEQSNRWSGGEKWSKNMTLFLGLLNYIAERKQYIQAQMKKHRTVILDNPFGKASSDHVLSPVFFIAEQLGFQIIALTAHVEGKFLQDYFPVVYSCRLRHAADSGKQIVEVAQTIQTAYFRDNDPQVLERIDAQVTQMELF
ncbi:chromosome segregation ATPase [Paenibacillus alvei]|uniref:chromosome segregation ATPase n=1 Tax=Paenibacillus alvei TaxID=44250 RepID=UPI00228228CE|nr:chromosome segregation ATPase [Paenibacillus alvei]MCY7487467.1 chromosome segregation ATPase [Paenibacillus alvei]